MGGLQLHQERRLSDRQECACRRKSAYVSPRADSDPDRPSNLHATFVLNSFDEVPRIAGAIASFDRNLPDNFGMKAKDLAVLLESYRHQALGADPNRYPIPWPAIEPE